MGNLFTMNMAANFNQNQQFIETMNKIKSERLIQMQYQIQQRQAAMQMARGRDLCIWLTPFYIISTVALVIGYQKSKKPFLLMPILPLTFVTAYQLDMGYGNKMHRIRMEAEHIMTHESDLLKWPCDLPTPASVQQGCTNLEEDSRKIHPSVRQGSPTGRSWIGRATH